MVLEYVKSIHGKDLLLQYGFTFGRKDKKKETTYWECTKRSSMGCRARCKTTGEECKITVKDHNHVVDPAERGVRTFMDNVKSRAKSEVINPARILATPCRNLPRAVAGQLPSTSLMTKTIQNSRRKHLQAPANPKTRAQLVIPDSYKTTFSGDEFLKMDSGPRDDRILIFTTDRNLSVLRASEKWFADGTFKSSPKLFTQLYTIHGLKDGSVLPLVYAILPNKTKQTYIQMLSKVKGFIEDIIHGPLAPRTVMTDFETAFISATAEAFPSFEQKACYFHFSQCIWRKIQSCPEILSQYTEDTEFALLVRQLLALAFVPEVSDAFQELMSSYFFVDYDWLLQPLTDYFEDVWIGRPRGAGRRQPLFPHQMWNCFDATALGGARTNNKVEGWNRRFGTILDASHPSLWMLIDKLKDEQSITELNLTQLEAGRSLENKRKKYRDLDARILKIVESYGQRSTMEYLAGLAHNLDFNV